MNKTAAIFCTIAVLSGCVSDVQPTATQPATPSANRNKVAPASVSNVSIANGESWRMTCQGGQGAMRVPIFARVTSFNPATGRVDLVVNDRDGYDGNSVAFLAGNKVSMFDATGVWTVDGRSARLSAPDLCPNGFLIERI